MKYFLSIIFSICLTQFVAAQFTLSGTIRDVANQEALLGATIYITDLKKGTASNLEGNYSLDNLREGNYLIEVNMLGYNTFVKRMQLNENKILDIQLSRAVSELNEVVVTAVTRSTELKQSPIIIKTIDAATLNEASSSNLVDALKNIPGIDQISTGASISKPIIRGLGYNRVITLYNGIRQEGQQWGDEHGIEIDQYDIERVEIVKGPGSLIYGSDGIAGVVNFLSPKAPHLDEIKTRLVTNYQSNNNLIGYSFSNAGHKKGIQWLARVSNKYASNYQNKYDGKVYNSGFKEFNANGFLGINRTWGHSHFNLSSYNTTLNLVEGERDSLGEFIVPLADGTERSATTEDLKGYGLGFPHQRIHHIRFSNNNYILLKKGTLNFDLAFQNNKRLEYADVTAPDDIELYFDLFTFNYSIRYNFKERKQWETSIGLSGMQQANFNKGEEFLIPEYQLFDVGAFIFTQKKFKEKLILAGGLRLDTRILNSKELLLDSLGFPTSISAIDSELKFKGFKENYYGVSGSIGLAYLLTYKSSLKFNLSRGFRAPTIAELASNGRHEGTFRYEIGNQNLKPEISHQIDIGYFFNAEHVTLEVTPFANFISNYVFLEKLKDAAGNDIIIDPSDPAPAFDFIQGNALLFGGEIYFDFHPHPLDWLHVANSFSFVQAQQFNASDSTKYLPFIPAPKYRGEIKAQFNKVGKVLQNTYIKFSVDYYFKQSRIFSAYNTETATPGYVLLSAGIGTSFAAFERKDFISFYLSADNLANIAYQSHLSRLKYAPENPATGNIGVYNMGRNISLKMILSL